MRAATSPRRDSGLAATVPSPAVHAQTQAGMSGAPFAALAASGVVVDTTIAADRVCCGARGPGACMGSAAGDVVLAAGGERPDPIGVQDASADGTVIWTVWRRVPGDRPVARPWAGAHEFTV
jgi:hypothetical protein